MIKTIVMAATTALMLGGCASTGTTPAVPPVAPTQVTAVIQQVQSAVATGCSIAASASSIAAVLDAIGVPYVGMVSDVARQICAAFNRPAARRRAGGPVSAVVVVRGRSVVVTGTRL